MKATKKWTPPVDAVLPGIYVDFAGCCKNVMVGDCYVNHNPPPAGYVWLTDFNRVRLITADGLYLIIKL